MKFFKKLFGSKPAATPKQPSEPVAAPDAELIKVYDAYGRPIQIPRLEWRDKVLMGNLEQVKDSPGDLYSVLVTALQDGFAQDVVKYAEHLQRTDSDQMRGATLLGVFYLELDRLNDAERVLTECGRRHGEQPYVLVNLAKVYAKRGETDRAAKTLWRSLELDPNQDNAVGWYWADARERGGEEAGLAALRKLAEHAASWRAQIWLARAALDSHDEPAAMKLYEEALDRVARPVPADLLMQIGGDLGNRGLLQQSLKLTLPHFDPAIHGLQVGNNLIKANVDLGRLDHAQQIVEQLYAQQRPDFREALNFWEGEIAKAHVARQNEDPTPAGKLSMLQIEGPVWLPAASPAMGMFPGTTKDEDAVVVCLLGGTVDYGSPPPADSVAAIAQLPDAPGRLSRSLPLFVAEQLFMQTSAQPRMLQPWLVGGGFAVAAVAWDLEAATELAKGSQPPGDYVVTLHVEVAGAAPVARWRLARCIDGAILDSGVVAAEVASLESCVTQLAAAVMAAICLHTAAEPAARPAAYQVPSGRSFDDYLLRLEQTLAVRVAGMDDIAHDFLTGEREIVAGNLFLCLAEPHNATTRAVLVETLRRIKKVRPQVVAEVRGKFEALAAEHPLPEPAQSTLAEMASGLFEG